MLRTAALLFGFLLMIAPTVRAAEKLDVYLLIGQSNMAGRAPMEAADKKPDAKVFLLNDKDQWEIAVPPLNRYSTIRKSLGMQKLNPGVTFARKMRAYDSSAAVGLVVNAKGGTSIRQWKKGTQFYNEAIRRAKIAQKTGTLKGILWHQGESDGNDAEYLPKLKQLIADLRADLGDKHLPFVAGQIKTSELINRQIAQLPKEVPHTAFAGSEGLTTQDRAHFDTKSMRTLGERYAEATIRILAKEGQPEETERSESVEKVAEMFEEISQKYCRRILEMKSAEEGKQLDDRQKVMARKLAAQVMVAFKEAFSVSEDDAKKILSGNFDDKGNSSRIKSATNELAEKGVELPVLTQLVLRRINSGQVKGGIELEFGARLVQGHLRQIKEAEK